MTSCQHSQRWFSAVMRGERCSGKKPLRPNYGAAPSSSESCLSLHLEGQVLINLSTSNGQDTTLSAHCGLPLTLLDAMVRKEDRKNSSRKLLGLSSRWHFPVVIKERNSPTPLRNARWSPSIS